MASIYLPTDYLRGEGAANPPGKLKLSLPMESSGHATEVGLFYSFEQSVDLEPCFVRPLSAPGLPHLPDADNYVGRSNVTQSAVTFELAGRLL